MAWCGGSAWCGVWCGVVRMAQDWHCGLTVVLGCGEVSACSQPALPHQPPPAPPPTSVVRTTHSPTTRATLDNATEEQAGFRSSGMQFDLVVVFKHQVQASCLFTFFGLSIKATVLQMLVCTRKSFNQCKI